MQLCSSFSMVKFMLVCCFLNSIKVLFMFVFLLFSIQNGLKQGDALSPLLSTFL
jgi:hypothetical protein